MPESAHEWGRPSSPEVPKSKYSVSQSRRLLHVKFVEAKEMDRKAFDRDSELLHMLSMSRRLRSHGIVSSC